MDSATRRLIARLGSRAERERTGLHVVEGVAPFLHACWSGASLLAIVHSRVLLTRPVAQRLVRQKKRDGVPTHAVGPEAFRDLSRASRASGVLAVARQRWQALGAIDPERGLGRLVLERVRSPGNLGTIFRTAHAAGMAGVIFLGPETDPLETAAVKASMGTVLELELTRTSHEAFRAWARRAGVWVIGTSPRADASYRDLTARPRQAVLFGDERAGLSPEALALCDACVSIPNRGYGDSLNVAVAAGIVMYELLAAASARR